MSFGGDSRAITQRLTHTFAAFARVVRAYRLYNADNATVVRMLDEVARQFTDLLNLGVDLTLYVQPEALLLGDTPVLEADAREESIPMAFYRDGIRRLEFAPGLTRDELEGFIEATSFGLHFAGVGDDIVSLLWRQDLNFINYLVVDTTIVESQQATTGPYTPALGLAAPIDAQINTLLTNIYGGSEEDDAGKLSLHLDGADLPAKVIAEALCDLDQMAVGLRPIRLLDRTPSYRAELEREVTEEGEFAISVRGLEGALASLAERIPPVEAEALAHALLRMLDTALLEDRFQVATGIVNGVRHSGQGRGLIGNWMDEVVSEARFRHVTAAFNSATAGPEIRATVLEYFKACGAWAVEPLLALLPSVSDAQLRRAVSNLILELGIVDLDPLQVMLHNEQIFAAQEAVYLMSKIGSQQSRQLLNQAGRHLSPQIRIAVLEQAQNLSRDVGRELISDLVLDPDSKVRAMALRCLARFPGHTSLMMVEGAVHKAALESQPFEYKRAALESYAVLAQNQGVQLLHRYIREGDGFLSGKEAEEIAVAATGAMARIRTVASVEVLKRTSGSRNKRLKETAKRALLFMKERP